MDIGASLPAGEFDLIICSEVFYYIHPFQRLNVARGMLKRLRPEGELLLVHSNRSESTTWPDVYGEGGAEGLHALFTRYLRMNVIEERLMQGYQIALLRPDTQFDGTINRLALVRLIVSNARAVVTHDFCETARALKSGVKRALNRD